MISGLALAGVLLAVAAAMSVHRRASHRRALAPSRGLELPVAWACTAAFVLTEAIAFRLLQDAGYGGRRLLWPVWGAGFGSLIGVATLVAFTAAAYRVRRPDEGIGAQFYGCASFVIGPPLGCCCGALLALLP